MNTTNLVLGKNTTYDNEYAPSRLQRIQRSLGRASIKNIASFTGYDVWRLYEMTYLGVNGLPKVCMGVMYVPSSSEYIVESKSLKLYELSFTMTKFESLNMVKEVFQRDLSNLLECDVVVELFELNNKEFKLENIKGTCLEEQDFVKELTFKDFNYDPQLLTIENNSKKISKTYYTNLFRSLCPVTSQPDHACIKIEYKGLQLSEPGLLSYLVSLRNHQGFHEQCVELIYSDIFNALSPEQLTVSAYFTRRGGIDINPTRSSIEIKTPSSFRTIRQ